MIEGLVLWFTTSKTGRTIALVGAAALAIGIAVLKVFSAGKASERAAQDQRSLDNLRERNEVDAEVDRAPAGELDDRLDRWVRPPRGE